MYVSSLSYSQATGGTYTGGSFQINGTNIASLGEEPATISYLRYSDSSPFGVTRA